MSTLSQFLGGGGIKSIQRGFTEFESTGPDRSTIDVPINPVVRSKSVVISSVAGDSLRVDFLQDPRDPNSSFSLAINSTAGIILGGNPSETTASNLTIIVGTGFIGASFGEYVNQSGILSWQVIEYED